jgi:hypothetical protein
VSESDVEAQLAAAAEACGILSLLGPLGQPERAFEFLSRITAHPESGAELTRLRASIPSEPGLNAVERTLLILASQHALTLVPGLAVSDRVKLLFAEEFQFFANPPAAWVARFQTDDVRYREMVRIATLRRFPAGQFHWEIAGFPRSWVAKANQPLKLLAHVAGRMGGFRPLFELHVNDRRRNRLILLEKEANISYYRAARSIEKQQEMLGLMTASWLFCESTAEVTPRLAWLRRTPLAGGAMIFDLGPAAADSGFMTGSDERRKLYEEGAYRPTMACVLWPRKRLIDWANGHPEFDL